MIWNAETIKELTSLWMGGVSTADIGRRMNMSKNAIVGKAHRLDLEPRPSPIRGGRSYVSSGIPSAKPLQMGVQTLPKLASEMVEPAPEQPIRAPVEAPEVLVRFRFARTAVEVLVAREPVVAPTLPKPTPIPVSFGHPCQWPMWKDTERAVFKDGLPWVCGEPKERGAYCLAHGNEAYSGRTWRSE